MINYSYLCALPGSQAENMCRISHGLQFVSFLSGVIWLRTLGDYSVLAENLQPWSTLHSYKKKKKKATEIRVPGILKLSAIKEPRKNILESEKKSVRILFLYLSLQILHTPEPCCKCNCIVMYMDTNVG